MSSSFFFLFTRGMSHSDKFSFNHATRKESIGFTFLRVVYLEFSRSSISEGATLKEYANFNGNMFVRNFAFYHND